MKRSWQLDVDVDIGADSDAADADDSTTEMLAWSWPLAYAHLTMRWRQPDSTFSLTVDQHLTSITTSQKATSLH